MIYEKLSPVVKAVRLRYAVPFVLLLAAAYWVGIYPWMANWGSTPDEQQMTLTGDDLHPDRTNLVTKAITIHAPAEVVWQWLVQVGQDRAGFYSYTWLENLVGADIHNVNEIRPEWQRLDVGDAWRLVPADYLWGLGKDAADPVLISEPGHALVLEMFGAHVIQPVDERTSRLIVRGKSDSTNIAVKMIWDPIVFTLERRMLLGIKARAEGRPDAPATLMAIAYLSWAAAGITVTVLFLNHRRYRYWLTLPVVAALPALLMSSDIQAGLAAYLAVGITVLGFLIFGRSFWGPYLVTGSIVLLTLLLAPDAYIVIGLAFSLLLLTTLGVIIATRARNTDAPGRQVTTSTQ